VVKDMILMIKDLTDNYVDNINPRDLSEFVWAVCSIH
jgi:hypothetical protein